jgi:nicotinamidase-related amidase
MPEIAANPFAYPLTDTKPALIVIDMQRDFVEAGGFGSSLGNDVTRLTGIIPTVKRLLDGCRALDMLIVHTREAHKPDLSDCPPAKRLRGDCRIRIGDDGPMGRLLIDGEPGAAIVPELTPLPGEVDLAKPGKGAFYNTPLQEILQQHGITHLLIAGVTTEVCVQTTMREANDRGYECLLVEDATESYFPEFKAATVDMITAQGAIVGWSAETDTVLQGLRETYG